MNAQLRPLMGAPPMRPPLMPPRLPPPPGQHGAFMPDVRGHFPQPSHRFMGPPPPFMRGPPPRNIPPPNMPPPNLVHGSPSRGAPPQIHYPSQDPHRMGTGGKEKGPVPPTSQPTTT